MKNTIKRGYRVVRYIIYRETLLRPRDHIWTFIGAFVAIATIGFFQQNQLTPQDDVFLIGSFGASCVLIFGATESPLAQPRNLVGGHLLASVIGVTIHKLFPGELWLSSGLSVALSIVVMQMTKTMHPPAGATALIANIGSPQIKALGFMYTLTPVLSGVTILLVTALIINNIPRHRSYPRHPLTWQRLVRRRKTKVHRHEKVAA